MNEHNSMMLAIGDQDMHKKEIKIQNNQQVSRLRSEGGASVSHQV